MATLLAQNASAYATLELACTNFAELIDCRHVGFTASSGPEDLSQSPEAVAVGRAHRPAKYIFMTLPQAIGLGLRMSPDLRFICVADMSPSTFRSYLGEKLDLEDEDLPPYDDASLLFHMSRLPTLEKLGFQGLGFEVLTVAFCTKHSTFDPLVPPPKTTHDRSKFLAELSDTHALHSLLNSAVMPANHDEALKRFLAAFLALYRCFCDVGLLGSTYRMLSLEALIWMCAEYFSRHMNENRTLPAISISELVDFAISHYFGDDLFQGRFRILTPSKRDLTKRISIEGVDAIRNAFSVLRSTPDTLTHAGNPGIKAVLGPFSGTGYFISIKAQCWTYKKLAALRESMPFVIQGFQSYIYAESRGQYRARLWPFEADQQQELKDTGVRYLLSAYKANSPGIAVDRADIEPLLDVFTQQLTYDTTSIYIDIGMMSTTEPLSSIFLYDIPPHSEHIVHKSAASGSEQRAQVEAPSAPAADKLRTASSAMNRLRWDPRHQSTDYEVGYLDRFEEALLWKVLENWERATEEEEFVPEHRVRQIRRKKDGEIIWDREKRLDLTGI